MDYARPGGVGWGVAWTSPGRRLDVGWLGLQREADFWKKVLPAAATALF